MIIVYLSHFLRRQPFIFNYQFDIHGCGVSIDVLLVFILSKISGFLA